MNDHNKQHLIELSVEYGYIACEKGKSLTQAKLDMISLFDQGKRDEVEREVDTRVKLTRVLN